MNRRPDPRYRQGARPAYSQGYRPAPSRQPAPQRTNVPPRQPAPRRAANRARGRWSDVALLAVGGLIVAALALALQQHWPNGFPLVKSGARDAAAVRAVSEIHSGGPLRINEIMTGNRRTFTDEDGASPDWVEIINVDSSAVNLKGYSLAKTDGAGTTFTFPDLTLQPQECALLLADSRLRADAGEALHLPFRLSSSGDTLMLFNPSGAAIDTVNIPALAADISYARADRTSWQSCDAPTPGLSNTQDSYRALTQPSGESPVILSEIVASNASALRDENGEFYDYIELYNRSDEAVDLTGWCLSDDAAEARKWSFPQTSIAPGEYLVVYASGLNRREDPAHLHTSFSLSSEGEQVALTDAQGRMMDRVDYGLLKSDVAWCLGADGNWKSAAPTPGQANP